MLKIRYIIFVALATATSAGLIDTNDCPTVYGIFPKCYINHYLSQKLFKPISGGITQSQCSTFAVSATFEDLCGAQNYFDVPGSQVCDVHCQCFHGAVWGQCLQRPSTGPVGSVLGFGNQYCTCYYEGDISPPTGWQSISHISSHILFLHIMLHCRRFHRICYRMFCFQKSSAIGMRYTSYCGIEHMFGGLRLHPWFQECGLHNPTLRRGWKSSVRLP